MTENAQPTTSIPESGPAAGTAGPGSVHRYDPLLVPLIVQTLNTGVIDAVSFLGLGRIFTANMTGNVALLGFALVHAHGLSAARTMASLSAFLVGGVVGGRIGVAMAAGSRRRWLVTIGGMEAILLLAAAGIAVVGGSESVIGLYGVIAVAAFAMGLRNATVRRLGVPDMSTTVLTMTLTGIAADSSLAGGKNTRMGRRLASLVAMIAGAAAGALLLRHGLGLALEVAGVIAVVATVLYARVPEPDNIDDRSKAG